MDKYPGQIDFMDINDNKTLAGLSYFLGYFFFIPMLVKKESYYLKYHANQFLLYIIASFVTSIPVAGIYVVSMVMAMGSNPENPYIEPSGILGNLVMFGYGIYLLVIGGMLQIGAFMGKTPAVPLIGHWQIIKWKAPKGTIYGGNIPLNTGNSPGTYNNYNSPNNGNGYENNGNNSYNNGYGTGYGSNNNTPHS